MRNTASSKLGLSPKAGPSKSRTVANGFRRLNVCPKELEMLRGNPVSSMSCESLTRNLRSGGDQHGSRDWITCCRARPYSSTIGRWRKLCLSATLCAARKRPCMSLLSDCSSSKRLKVSSMDASRSIGHSHVSPLVLTKSGPVYARSANGTTKSGTRAAQGFEGGYGHSARTTS